MEISEFFREHSKVALCFSGGVDSAYLLYAGLQCGARIRPYYVKTDFQPKFELEDAKRFSGIFGVPLTVLKLDILSFDEITDNPKDRCYLCKHKIISLIKERALEDGFHTIIDGTNASDESLGRPGMRALKELQIYSPLKDCGLIKDRIRQLSKAAGLFTWNKPAYACLATRIPTGDMITKEKLRHVEKAEEELFKLGFTDFRIRIYHDAARIQLKREQLCLAIQKKELLKDKLSLYFNDIFLDLDWR